MLAAGSSYFLSGVMQGKKADGDGIAGLEDVRAQTEQLITTFSRAHTQARFGLQASASPKKCDTGVCRLVDSWIVAALGYLYNFAIRVGICHPLAFDGGDADGWRCRARRQSLAKAQSTLGARGYHLFSAA